MSLILVRCPSPFDLRQTRTRGSSRTLTGILACLTSRNRQLFFGQVRDVREIDLGIVAGRLALGDPAQ